MSIASAGAALAALALSPVPAAQAAEPDPPGEIAAPRVLVRDGATTVRSLLITGIEADSWAVEFWCRGSRVACPAKRGAVGLNGPTERFDVAYMFRRHRFDPGSYFVVTLSAPRRTAVRTLNVVRRDGTVSTSWYCTPPGGRIGPCR